MDFNEIQDAVGWIIGVFALGIVSLVAGIYNIIKTEKLAKRDIRSADLTNESKEVDLAKIYKAMATETAIEQLEIVNRLKKLEDKSEEQEELIKQQSKIIEEQTKRLDMQEKKIEEQEVEIEKLRCELNNSKIYNNALIQQMKDNNIIPVEQSNLPQKDCESPTIPSTKRKKNGQ